MRISTFILSFCSFCVLYISHADWIDELIEDYLGSDYEEVAPFISSVTAGTEEFDQLVEEMSQSKRKWWLPSPVVFVSVLSALTLVLLMHRQVGHSTFGCDGIKKAFKFVTGFRRGVVDRDEIQTIVSEFLERKLKHLCGNKTAEQDVPVKLLWKGGSLVESSVHCSLREESKFQQMQRRFLQSKLSFGSKGEGDKAVALAPSSSETSTARKMAEIRELLESEQEIQKFSDGDSEIDGGAEGKATERKAQAPGDVAGGGGNELQKFYGFNEEGKTDQGRKEEVESNSTSEWEVSPDPKLMNRIRLLESRLRLEELKNKSWISRMSRAEDILQQLNKQVELIEETRPLRTLTETLKITSTFTNWEPPSRPRRNMQFTLVNQYPPCCVSLSELIKKEVGFPTPVDYSKTLIQFPPTPQIPAPPSPIVMPQSSFLSKFLCR